MADLFADPRRARLVLSVGFLLFCTWIFAILTPPMISGTLHRPDPWLWCLMAALYSYFGYTGIRAWRRGWRSRFILRIVVPLSLFAISSALTVSGVWRLLAVALAPIQQAARADQHLRLHQSGVHAHAIVGFVDGSPVGDAAALFASMELEHAVAPHVDVSGTGGRREMDEGWGVIGPEGAVAAADRTGALVYRFGGLSDFEVDQAAVAGSFDHGGAS